MDKICITTEVLCDLLANKKETVEQLEKLEKEAVLAVAPFVLFELFSIAEASQKPENSSVVWDIVHRLTLLEWTPEACADAAKLFTALQKQGKKTELRDIFIGVLAAQNKYALLTSTPDPYKDIPGIKIYGARL